MAAAGRSIFDVLKEQKTTELDEAGITGAKKDEELAVHRKFLELMASDREVKPDEVRADYRSALRSRAWIKSHAKQDPITAMKRVHCPVLVLQGEKDIQVSAERDAKPLAAALDAAHNEDHELKLFPDLDHLFKKVEGARSQLSDYAKKRPVDPEFLDVLVRWLSARLEPSGG
jgi:pimeloyl-ACP methyl ester carboxylesterase